jgi:hypothetical protein
MYEIIKGYDRVGPCVLNFCQSGICSTMWGKSIPGYLEMSLVLLASFWSCLYPRDMTFRPWGGEYYPNSFFPGNELVHHALLDGYPNEKTTVSSNPQRIYFGGSTTLHSHQSGCWSRTLPRLPRSWSPIELKRQLVYKSRSLRISISLLNSFNMLDPPLRGDIRR